MDSIDLDCRFTGCIEPDQERHLVGIPAPEVEVGIQAMGDICRINVHQLNAGGSGANGHWTGATIPPVSEGEQCTVEIEDVGDQGDRIVRVDCGYVLIVPESEPGEEVLVEITKTTRNTGLRGFSGSAIPLLNSEQ